MNGESDKTGSTGEAEVTSIELDDLPGIVTLFVEVFNNHPWNEKWTYSSAYSRLDDIVHTPRFTGFKAVEDQSLSGFLMGYGEPFDEGIDFYVKEMCVADSRQRRGIGGILLSHLTRQLSSAGVRRIYLLTSRDGYPAKFYEKHGFTASDRMIVMRQTLRKGKRQGPHLVPYPEG